MVGIQSAYSEVGHKLTEKLGLAQNRGEESKSEFPAPESCTQLSHQHLCWCTASSMMHHALFLSLTLGLLLI